MATEGLRALIEGGTGCGLALYADLSLPMALVSEVAKGAETPHRETLQALAVEAKALLEAPGPAEEDAAAHDVLVWRDGRLALFLRHPEAPAEALCCLLAPGADPEAARAAARACLTELAA